MLLFQPPTPTRYDLNFSFFGIPVRVHPLFWLLTLLFGASGGLLSLLIWIIVIFISILVHELGHAFMFRRFGLPSSVILYWGGGLTVPEQQRWGHSYSLSLGLMQEVFVSLAGPFSGFLLAALILLGARLAGGSIGLSSGLLPFPVVYMPWGGMILNAFIGAFLWVNIFWGIINLMPVYPLDGGSVARNLMIKADPVDGGRRSLWVSVITGAAIALIGLLLMRSIFLAFLFGYLAWMSYQSLNPRF